MLVLAFGVHDVRPGRSTATYLSSVTPGEPVAYAICDQGTLAPFTALRLLGEYARSGCAARSMLVVAEQSALHYTPAVPGPLPDRHAAVAFLFDGAGRGALRQVRQVAGLPAAELGPALAAEVAGLAAGRGDVTLVPGVGLAGVPVPEGLPLSRCPAGQPHTGPWWVLADWSAAGLVLLADADPGAGELAVAALDFSPDPGGH
jgi:4-hydroxymandelate oxidase